jgi:hypothetical protein
LATPGTGFLLSAPSLFLASPEVVRMVAGKNSWTVTVFPEEVC